MARIAGRNGSLYVAIASGGTAEPVTFLDKWSISFKSGRTKVTAMGDTNEVYVAGLPDAQGDYSGWFDTAGPQLYTAAVDGIARKAYLYADRSGSPGIYWFGTAFFDMDIDGSVEGAVAIKGSWNAASTFAKVG